MDCDPAASCPASDMCSVATCAFGVCGIEPAPGTSGEDTECDDNDYLTGGDVCSAGYCRGLRNYTFVVTAEAEGSLGELTNG